MPILGLLFLVAVGYAMSEGWKELRKGAPAGSRPAGGRRRTPAQSRVDRTRQAGYWGHQLLNGFPSFRHGTRRGWTASRQAMHGGITDGITGRADWAETLADHKRRRAEAMKRIEATRQQSSQPAAPATPQQPATTVPPLPAEHLSPSQPPTQNGHDPMACKDPGCQCHQQSATTASRPAAGPTANGAGPVSDINYPLAVEKSQALIDAADQGVNEQLINEATQLADELGAMVPTDSTTQGQAADVASAAADVIAAQKRLADAAAGLKNRLETTYGPTHEDVQASGEDAAQPAFHNA